jgi:hypothetical protein
LNVTSVSGETRSYRMVTRTALAREDRTRNGGFLREVIV